MTYKESYGMIYDTLISLVYQFNPDKLPLLQENTGLDHSGIHWMEAHLTMPEESLALFFRIAPGHTDSFLQSVFSAYGGDIMSLTFAGWAEELLADRNFAGKLWGYYLPDRALPDSLKEQRKYLQASTLEASLKFGLLSFLLEPEPYLSVLREALRERFLKLSALYPSMNDCIHALEEETAYKLLRQVNPNIRRCKEIVYSVSVLCELTFTLRILSNHPDGLTRGFFNVGLNWREALLNASSNHFLDLQTIGKVFSEKNRCEILEYLDDHDTITIAEAIEYLNISLTAANYHLNLMADAGALSTYNIGRKIYFYPNRKFMERAALTFRNLANRIPPR